MHFIGFKIGSAILNLFINTEIGSLVPFAKNPLQLIYFLIAGILIPICIGFIIDKLKLYLYKEY